MSIVGLRFDPSDEELVNHYLKHKICGNDFMARKITQIDLLNFAPCELPAKLKMKSDDKEGFFFTCLDLMKINKTTRYNRKAKGGYWKISGKPRIIKTKATKEVIGKKQTVLFYTSLHKKTNWVYHEYSATGENLPPNKTNLVLGPLMKQGEHVTHSSHVSCHVSAPDFEKQPMMDLAQDIGYRFRPTEEELLSHYLKHKLVGNDSMVSIITEIHLNNIESWELPAALPKITPNDSEWYFFTTDDLKYKKGRKCKRSTNAGYWNLTGITREIKIKGTNNVIGRKKIYVFYKYCGSHVEKTNYVIHQYHAIKVPDNKRNFVLCRLKEKTEVTRVELMYDDEGESSHVARGNELESIAATDLTPNVCGSPEVNMEYYLSSPHEDDYSFPAATNQTPYFEGLISSNSYFETENSNAGFPFETDHENNVDYNSFFNSNLEDGDVYISEGTS